MKMSKEKPILFSADMVRAILDGRKTQTRRLSGLEDVNKSPDIWRFNKVGILDYMTKPRYKGRFGAYFETESLEPNTLHICPVTCPYGKPGDLLWVRETWGLYDTEPKDGPEKAIIFYRASDGDNYELRYQLWRPSIFMPRWASRITLEITGVRVERLQDISEGDAISEGVRHAFPSQDDNRPPASYDIAAFAQLWDSINAKRGYSWSSNPWVWVIEFQRAEARV
jgi:hypothetical protein